MCCDRGRSWCDELHHGACAANAAGAGAVNSISGTRVSITAGAREMCSTLAPVLRSPQETIRCTPTVAQMPLQELVRCTSLLTQVLLAQCHQPTRRHHPDCTRPPSSLTTEFEPRRQSPSTTQSLNTATACTVPPTSLTTQFKFSRQQIDDQV